MAAGSTRADKDVRYHGVAVPDAIAAVKWRKPSQDVISIMVIPACQDGIAAVYTPY